MTLREAQVLFAYQLARLIIWVREQGWEVTLGEGYVGDTDAADGDYDGPHMKEGQHYRRLGQDLNLFVREQNITWSDHPVWKEIGRKWKTMDSLCRWGGDFQQPDANHFSFLWVGKA